MISKKIISAVLALTTAFTPVISGGQNAMAKSDIVYVYPNWVPDDYDSALEFYNTYGVTRVEGPFVCMVFKEMLEDLSGPDMLDFPRYEISYGSKVMKPDFTKEYTRSEKPGKNDTVFEVILSMRQKRVHSMSHSEMVMEIMMNMNLILIKRHILSQLTVI